MPEGKFEKATGPLKTVLQNKGVRKIELDFGPGAWGYGSSFECVETIAGHRFGKYRTAQGDLIARLRRLPSFEYRLNFGKVMDIEYV